MLSATMSSLFSSKKFQKSKRHYLKLRHNPKLRDYYLTFFYSWKRKKNIISSKRKKTIQISFFRHPSSSPHSTFSSSLSHQYWEHSAKSFPISFLKTCRMLYPESSPRLKPFEALVAPLSWSSCAGCQITASEHRLNGLRAI